ncbi:hypothetical protein C8R47DRAFT_1227205 [Mycena vitilis]|nr:hypothetical protein C8R47DRAFT_1227205 [Mycena vitilis]
MSSLDHSVNPDQATVLGFGLEGVAYGINAVLFGVAMVILVNRDRASKASKIPMMVLSCFMFSLGTVHFSLNFNNVYSSLMVHVRPHIAAETDLLIGADSIFMLSDFASQLILIYRCYLVWGKTLWVAVLPLLVALGSFSCGFAEIGLVRATSPTAPQAPAALVPIGTASFALSLCLNFMVSALIVGRIWWVTRMSRQHGLPTAKTSITRAMEIVVESGFLFLAAQLVFVVLFAIGHPAQAVVEPVATQIYGISPMLIIVRVGMGAAYEQTTNAPISTLRFKFSRKTETDVETGVNESSTQHVQFSELKDSSRGTLTDPGV